MIRWCSLRFRREAGNAQVEFALCAIFVIFMMISMFDLARGLWIYHTVAEAVRDGTRYSIVRGGRYVNPATSTRMPDAILANALTVIRQGAVGLDPQLMQIRFETVTLDGTPSTFANCDGFTCGGTPTNTPWPPDNWKDFGQVIGITMTYPYNSLVVMFFPSMKGAVRFGNYQLGSTSRGGIVF